MRHRRASNRGFALHSWPPHARKSACDFTKAAPPATGIHLIDTRARLIDTRARFVTGVHIALAAGIDDVPSLSRRAIHMRRRLWGSRSKRGRPTPRTAMALAPRAHEPKASGIRRLRSRNSGKAPAAVSVRLVQGRQSSTSEPVEMLGLDDLYPHREGFASLHWWRRFSRAWLSRWERIARSAVLSAWTGAAGDRGGSAAQFDVAACGRECFAGVAGKRPPASVAPEDPRDTVSRRGREVIDEGRLGIIHGAACQSVDSVAGRRGYQYSQPVLLTGGRRDEPDPERLLVWAGQ